VEILQVKALGFWLNNMLLVAHVLLDLAMQIRIAVNYAVPLISFAMTGITTYILWRYFPHPKRIIVYVNLLLSISFGSFLYLANTLIMHYEFTGGSEAADNVTTVMRAYLKRNNYHELGDLRETIDDHTVSKCTFQIV